MVNNKKEMLEKAKKELEPKAKFWNQNSLFLLFAASFSIVATTGIDLFKLGMPAKYHFLGIFMFFIFGLVVCLISAKTIDDMTKNTNITLKTINGELKK